METSPPTTGLLKCLCVATRIHRRALSYSTIGMKIEISKTKTETISALTDGVICYLNKKEGSTPEFEEGVSYILQKHTLSNKFGQMYLFVGPGSLKFKTTPHNFSEAAQTSAKEALCPPSPEMTGGEPDIFSRGGHISLRGQITEFHGVRMTRARVPIVDLKIKCLEGTFSVSLWREAALTELFVGDEVLITHLRPCVQETGTGKFHSSNYTTVEIAEGQMQETVVEVIGVSNVNHTCHFLGSDSQVYVVPQIVFAGNPDDLIARLPLHLSLKHVNRRVFQISEVSE